MSKNDKTPKSQDDKMPKTKPERRVAVRRKSDARSKRMGNIILAAMELDSPTTALQDMHFAIATEQWQIEQAFTLLKDSYIEEGYIRETGTSLHATKYHILPTTSILIAYRDHTVVATVSIIKDGLFGIPANAVTPKHEEGYLKRAEVSGFVIADDYRNQEGQILLPLFKFLSHYCRKHLAIDHLIISVHPNHFSFYEYLLGFDEIVMTQTENYQFANGKPVKCGRLDLHQFPEVIRKHFSENDGMKDLYGYFKSPAPITFHYPKRIFDHAFDLIWTPEMMTYFFAQQTNIFDQLDANDRETLWNLYVSTPFQTVFEEQLPRLAPRKLVDRNHVRIDVKFKARLHTNAEPTDRHDADDQDVADTFADGFIRDASMEGFSMYCPNADITLNTPFRIQIRLEAFSLCELTATPMHKIDNDYYGFKITASSKIWIACITALVNHFENIISHTDAA